MLNKLIALLTIALLITACQATPEPTEVITPPTAQSPHLQPPISNPPTLKNTQTWLYLIDVNLAQNTVTQIADSNYDMVILDYIPSKSNNTDYPIADVIDLLHHADHPKRVIAYIDIGEAESYRTYWQDVWDIVSPEWIVTGDPDGWDENYPVAYWYDDWQKIWLDKMASCKASSMWGSMASILTG
jgi:cysteinyl-tRNA synthetase